MSSTTDPFAQFKAAQREGWALFAPLATFSTPPAASLVQFSANRIHQSFLMTRAIKR